LCNFLTPHFAVAGLCYAKPFYATAKRQLPRTLNAMPNLEGGFNTYYYAENFRMEV